MAPLLMNTRRNSKMKSTRFPTSTTRDSSTCFKLRITPHCPNTMPCCFPRFFMVRDLPAFLSMPSFPVFQSLHQTGASTEKSSKMERQDGLFPTGISKNWPKPWNKLSAIPNKPGRWERLVRLNAWTMTPTMSSPSLC